MKPFFLLCRLSFFLILGLSWNVAEGQSLRAYEKASEEAMAQQNYFAAYSYLKEAILIDTSLVRLKAKFAKAAYHWQSYEEAATYFEQANSKDIYATAPNFEYDWGLNSMALGRYEEAMTHFKAFSKKGGRSKVIRQKAKNKLKACEYALKIKKKPVEAKITHLDKNVNSPYSEFAPIQKGDDFYYSALKFKKTGKKKDTYFTRILSAKEGEKGKPLKKGVNQKDIHNAHISFSQDEEWLYFTRCETLKEGGIRCKIYRRKWQEKRPKDELLPTVINLEGTTATHPTIGFDSLTKEEFLFFASDRTGGKGGLDIWQSTIKNGQFSKPKNLGRNVNTKGNEITPFFDNQFLKLYFSSDEHLGLGGYDVFFTKRKNKTQWEKPRNIGFPLNSSYNDIYFSMNENGYTGYFSSNRVGAFLLTKSACCNDIFKFELPKPILPKKPTIDIPIDTIPLVEVPVDTTKTDIPSITEEPNEPKEELTFDEELSKMLPIALYFDNDQPNPRTTQTTTKFAYNETYYKYYDRKNTFINKFTSPLNATDKVNGEIEINSFFSNEVKGGFDKLERLYALLLIELQKGRVIEIYIKGYTSQLASGTYNVNLSKRRIVSVKNYLDRVGAGTLKAYINSNQLKIIDVPFGEAQSKEKVKMDRRSSIYSVEASRERRVEIIEVK
jgi:tetratricopeptide (TPR) repeat protein